MNLFEMFKEPEVGPPEPTLIDALRDFLPIAIKHLNLDHIPKIKLAKEIADSQVPTFGRFENESKIITVVIDNRNIVDTLRTLAHEMVHYQQGEEHRLDADSWETGSPIEDEANAEGGVIMRLFNQAHPNYMLTDPIVLPEGWSQKYKKSINCSNPKGFSQKAHCAGRKKANEEADYERDMQSDPSNPFSFPKGTTLVNVSDVYDWYKLGMAVPALDKADPRVFNKGVPHTVFAFGSEEEEHRMMPLLKRLGFSLHDIDKPEDYEKAIRASDVVEHLESYVAENFADGKNPQDKGDSARHGIPKGATMAQLEKAAKAPGRKGQLARWQINMRRGKKK
jgi:hypothetical protein